MDAEQNMIPISIHVEGIDTPDKAEKWLLSQAADVRETTFVVHEGKLMQKPVAREGAFVDPAARLIGGMIIMPGCYIGPYSVIRLDEKSDPQPLIIGEKSNIQDGAIVHSTCTNIGRRVIIAHQAIVHGAHVEDDVTIYIQAVADGEGTVIGAGSFLHHGSYVGKGLEIAPNSYIGPGVRVLDQNDADGLPQVPENLKGLREDVLMDNISHCERYLSMNEK